MRSEVSRRTLLAAAALAPLAARAQDTPSWPPREVRIIVPFPVGRVTDLVARIVADGLRARYGVSVVVDNRPGANAVIGLDMLHRAAPDGATLLVGGLGSHGLPPAVSRRYPFDVNRDFTSLAIMAEFVNVMVIGNDVPCANVTEFVTLAKTRPGGMNYAFTSVGASNQLTAELFKLRTGTELVGVPLGQAGNTLVLLQRGDVQVAFENLPTVAGAIRGGTLRALAVTSPYRTPQLPDIPTLQEAGLPDFSVTSWIGLYAPPGLPPGLRDRIEADLRAISATETAQELLRKAGFEPTFRASAEFTAFQRGEVERWRGVVRDAKLQLED